MGWMAWELGVTMRTLAGASDGLVASGSPRARIWREVAEGDVGGDLVGEVGDGEVGDAFEDGEFLQGDAVFPEEGTLW